MAIIFGPSLWQNKAYESEDVQYASLGDEVRDGGYLICRNGGTAWIVAPSSSEVVRTWFAREDAITTATACTNDTGWFVPNVNQLVNPGYTCRIYWDSYSASNYWSSTPNYTFGIYVQFSNGEGVTAPAGWENRVRAFRCIAY
jgi:hypothetical protein